FGGGWKRLGVHFSSSELARRRDDGESGRWRRARQLRLSHECLGRAFRQIGKRSFVQAWYRRIGPQRDSPPFLTRRIQEHDHLARARREWRVEKSSSKLDRLAAAIFAAIGRELHTAALAEFSASEEPH